MNARNISQIMGAACVTPDMYNDAELNFNVEEANTFFDNYKIDEENKSENVRSKKTSVNNGNENSRIGDNPTNYNKLNNINENKDIQSDKSKDFFEKEIEDSENVDTIDQSNNVRNSKKENKTKLVIMTLFVLTIVSLYHILMYTYYLLPLQNAVTEEKNDKKHVKSLKLPIEYVANENGTITIDEKTIEYFQQQLNELKDELRRSKNNEQTTNVK